MRSGEDHDYHLRLSREDPAALLDIASTYYRKGAADQLTGPGYGLMIAENTLRTILPMIERGRIRLPAGMPERKLASVHRWIGRESLRSPARARGSPGRCARPTGSGARGA